MPLNIRKMRLMQDELAKKVVLKKYKGELKTLAAVEVVAYENTLIASVVVFDFATLKVLERQHSVKEADMPYIPSLLGFREGPVAVDAFSKLAIKPDILIVDGNGILHPAKLGFASQLGIQLDLPSIGIAKSLLCGAEKDGFIYVDERKVGAVLKTKEQAKPLYLSPGHMVDLEQAMEICKRFISPMYKLPEPLHIAHKFANEIKKKLKE